MNARELRDLAASEGRARYYTGDPCKRGHLAERFTANGGCVECMQPKRYKAHTHGHDVRRVTYAATVTIDKRLTPAHRIALNKFLQDCVAAFEITNADQLEPYCLCNGYGKLIKLGHAPVKCPGCQGSGLMPVNAFESMQRFDVFMKANPGYTVVDKTAKPVTDGSASQG